MTIPEDYQPAERRPIKSRGVRLFQQIASWLAGHDVAPNLISSSSVVFAVFAAGAFICTGFVDGWLLRGCWFLAALFIQFRLLANMLDGMVAVETETTSPLGELFNEVPDRISDTAILVGAGWAVGGSPLLGCGAAIVALFVAYVRVTGASVGAGHDFSGPCAKPHRMFLLTVLSLYGAATPITWQPVIESGHGITAACLLLITFGGLLTAGRRLLHIGAAVRAR